MMRCIMPPHRQEGAPGSVTESKDYLGEYQQLVKRWEDSLQRDAERTTFEPPRPVVELAAEYNLLNDGTAHHVQAFGWRMVLDVIMDKLIQAANAELHEEPSRRDIQLGYQALQRRQLAYPFLAAWRLCIEVALKEAIAALARASGWELSSRDKRAMSSHDIAYLWALLKKQLSGFEATLQQLATRLCVDDAPGFRTTTAQEHDASVDQLTSIDADGTALRYELSLNGSRNMVNVSTINLTEVHQKLATLYAWLEHVKGIAVGVRQLDECDAEIEKLSDPQPLSYSPSSAEGLSTKSSPSRM